MTAETTVTTMTATYGEFVRGLTLASASGATRSIDQPNMHRVMISRDIGTVGSSHDPKPMMMSAPNTTLPENPAAPSIYVGDPPTPSLAGPAAKPEPRKSAPTLDRLIPTNRPKPMTATTAVAGPASNCAR